MDINYDVPFYPNTEDNTHCFQAGLKSVLKYFIPEKDFSWDELDKATAKVEGLWTWPMAGLIWMKEQGFEVKNIEDFDYDKLIQRGKDYLAEKYGADIAEVQVKNSDLPQELEIAKKFITAIDTDNRAATIDDILQLLQDGYLVCANVNYRSLHDKPGYVGHFIVIKGVKGNNFILHDSGLPAIENMVVSSDQFDKGWAYPTPKERNIMAFRKV
jgi:hypothetical protein